MDALLKEMEQIVYSGTRLNIKYWIDDMLDNKISPQITWALEGEETLRISATSTPKEVKLWQATNPNARDFRLETFGPKWTSNDLTAEADGTYQGRVSSPAKGWTASMVELTFDVGAPVPLKLTTDVRVIPDTLPHPAPSATRPKGYLTR